MRGFLRFRGQALASWHLESSFDRIHPSLKNKIQDYERLLHYFSEEVIKAASVNSSVLNGGIDGGDRKVIASLAQHHGLPTRLLDWSVSPYVAAFFAFEASLKLPVGSVEEEEDDGNVAVWVLDTDAESVWQEGLGANVWEASRISNIRAHRQSGWFSELRSTHKWLEEYVASFGVDLDGVPLRKIAIPRSEAPLAVRDLRLMNISSTTLFPDNDGIARDAFLRWSLAEIS